MESAQARALILILFDYLTTHFRWYQQISKNPNRMEKHTHCVAGKWKPPRKSDLPTSISIVDFHLYKFSAIHCSVTIHLKNSHFFRPSSLPPHLLLPVSATVLGDIIWRETASVPVVVICGFPYLILVGAKSPFYFSTARSFYPSPFLAPCTLSQSLRASSLFVSLLFCSDFREISLLGFLLIWF